MPDSNAKPVRKAATVMLIRPAEVGFEVFMLQRPGRGAFPDLHVFPGGKVETYDENFDRHCDSLTDAGASRILSVCSNGLSYWIAAIRECFEECGVLLANQGNEEFEYRNSEQVEEFDNVRHALATDELNFAEFLTENGLTLATSRVHYFSHWITPKFAPARFNTRFFLAEMPANQMAVKHATELVSGTWIEPKQALRHHATGEWQMIVPTLTSLRMLCGYESARSLIDTVLAGGHKIPVTPSLHAQGIQYDPNLWLSDSTR